MRSIYARINPIPNYDSAAAIHYGVIGMNSLDGDAASDMTDGPHSRDLSYEYAKKELIDGIIRALDSDPSRGARIEALEVALSNLYYGKHHAEERETAISELIEQWEEVAHATPPDERDRSALWEIIEDRFNDCYDPQGEADWLYEHEGYSIQNCLQNDAMVTKSPFFTYAPECSPCCPNAGNLDDAEAGKLKCFSCGFVEAHWITAKEGVRDDGYGILLSCDNCGSFRSPNHGEVVPLKTYCLGHDYFEDGQAPYPVFSVATGEEVTK